MKHIKFSSGYPVIDASTDATKGERAIHVVRLHIMMSSSQIVGSKSAMADILSCSLFPMVHSTIFVSRELNITC